MSPGDSLLCDGLVATIIQTGHLYGAIGAVLTVGSYRLLWLNPASESRLDGSLPGIDEAEWKHLCNVNVAILDGTLLDAPYACLSEQQLLESLVGVLNEETAAARRVLIPVSAVGRAQSLLYSLGHARISGALTPDFRLWVSPKIDRIHRAFAGVDVAAARQTRWWNVLPSDSQVPARGEALLAETRCLFPESPSGKAFAQLRLDPETTMVVTGFAIPGSPLETVMERVRQRRMSDEVSAGCRVVFLPSSDHLNYGELSALVSRFAPTCRVWILRGDGRLSRWSELPAKDVAWSPRALDVTRWTPQTLQHHTTALMASTGLPIAGLANEDQDATTTVYQAHGVHEGSTWFEYGGYRRLILPLEDV